MLANGGDREARLPNRRKGTKGTTVYVVQSGKLSLHRRADGHGRLDRHHKGLNVVNPSRIAEAEPVAWARQRTGRPKIKSFRHRGANLRSQPRDRPGWNPDPIRGRRHLDLDRPRPESGHRRRLRPALVGTGIDRCPGRCGLPRCETAGEAGPQHGHSGTQHSGPFGS